VDYYDAPTDIATCMYYTGIDPFTKRPVTNAKGMGDQKMQPALMQFFKPENWFTARLNRNSVDGSTAWAIA
jgi:hypothetical protein